MIKYRVTGDFLRLVYSTHKTEQAAIRAAKSLTRKWGESHTGSEPMAECRTDNGWICIWSPKFQAN